MTVNQILALFKDIATRHQQINDFKISQDFNIDTGAAPNFTILVVNPVSANLPRSANGFTSFITTLDLQLIDIVEKDNSNEIEVLSDTVDVLRDVINEFNTHPYYIDNGIDIINSISFETLRGVYDSDVDGWKCQIELESPNKLSYCGSPIDNLSGFDFDPAAVTITDGIQTILKYPDQSYTCDGSDVENSDQTYQQAIVSGATLVLPDITHTDSDGSPSILPAQIAMVCTPVTSPSGIAYKRPQLSGQITSYATGDDADNLANGLYDYTPPTYPVSYAKLDTTHATTPFLKLESNNAFSNLDRFTDINGLQVYGDDYAIDHLTGLGWYTLQISSASWSNQIIAANASTQNGFSDWRMCNIPELFSIRNANYKGLNYIPFSIGATGSNDNYVSTTRGDQSSATFKAEFDFGFRLINVAKTASNKMLMCRNHYS